MPTKAHSRTNHKIVFKLELAHCKNARGFFFPIILFPVIDQQSDVDVAKEKYGGVVQTSQRSK